MTRVIEFINPVIDWSVRDNIVKIVPEIEQHIKEYNSDYIYNEQIEFDISIDQIEQLSEEYTISIDSTYIKIVNL